LFHTERDSAVFLAEVLLFLATGVGAVFAIAVLVALIFKVFGSLRALCVALVLSAVVSVPFVLALLLQWPYLPREWDINPTTRVLTLVDGMLLCFVWLAPVLQYCLAQPRVAQQGRPEASPDRGERIV
jgi:hypothetical protein